MTTIGNIIDQISILEQRIKVSHDKQENTYALREQLGWLFKSMGDVLIESFSGQRPFTFAKNKHYDSAVQVDDNMSLLETITLLNRMNQKLWALEDMRRDETTTDEQRLKAADSVSVHNKMRNDAIDKIDAHIQGGARHSHNRLFQKDKFTL